MQNRQSLRENPGWNIRAIPDIPPGFSFFSPVPENVDIGTHNTIFSIAGMAHEGYKAGECRFSLPVLNYMPG
jgi:hypothetical protein